MFTVISFVALTLSTVVSAQSLSANCTNTLTNVAAHPEVSACLDIASIASIAFGARNTSIVPSIDSWLTSFCAAQPCSNRTLEAIVTNITAGCSSDISLPTSSPSAVVALAWRYYPPVRRVLCLKDSGTNCVTQTLTYIEDIIGPLNISSIITLILNPNPDQIPANVTCTDCVKAAYNIINHDIPELVSDTGPSLRSHCNSSFTDGTTPPGISQAAAGPTTTASSARIRFAVQVFSPLSIAITTLFSFV